MAPHTTHKVLPALGLRVPEIELLADEFHGNSGEDGIAEDDAEDGEDQPADEDPDHPFVAPIHREPNVHAQLR